MKKKTGLLLSMVLASSTLLAACGGTDDESTQTGNGEKANDLRVGMVTDIGGIDDKSFNQSSWEGLKLFAEENGLVVDEGIRYLQSQTEADYVPNLTQFAEANFDLIYGVGFLLEKPMIEVAANFPDINFAIIDTVVEKDNVASITFKEHEGSFLVGVVAALQTETNTVGFIGGVESELIRRFEAGFKAGVRAVNPEIEVISSYAGAFNRPEIGAQLASAMYSQGADIIYHAAGGTGNGVFTEAQNRARQGENVWVIGVDRDQHEEGMPENVTLTSMVKRVDRAVYKLSTLLKEGNFPGGEVVTYGLADEGVDIAPTTDNLSDEIIAKVDEFREKIIAGEIVVPSTLEELEAQQ